MSTYAYWHRSCHHFPVKYTHTDLDIIAQLYVLIQVFSPLLSYTYWHTSCNHCPAILTDRSCHHCPAILTDTGLFIIVQHHARGTGTGEAAVSVFARVWTRAGTLTAFVYVCDDRNRVHNYKSHIVYTHNIPTAVAYVCYNTNIYTTLTAFLHACDDSNTVCKNTVYDNTQIIFPLDSSISVIIQTYIAFWMHMPMHVAVWTQRRSYCNRQRPWWYNHASVALHLFWEDKC